jgi:hypothetical protein
LGVSGNYGDTKGYSFSVKLIKGQFALTSKPQLNILGCFAGMAATAKRLVVGGRPEVGVGLSVEDGCDVVN